jgi:hypothetical protein
VKEVGRSKLAHEVLLDACNGRPTHRFSINSSPTESNSSKYALIPDFPGFHAGQPLQGECRRFDPVSTHHKINDFTDGAGLLASGLGVRVRQSTVALR